MRFENGVASVILRQNWTFVTPEDKLMRTNRTVARQLAHAAVAEGKPLEWFETLYSLAGDDPSAIPWADMTVNPNLVLCHN